MMTRQELIEEMYESIKDDKLDEKVKVDVNKLLRNLVRGKVTQEDAEAMLSMLLRKSKVLGYWIRIFKPKIIYNTLRKFYGKELTNAQIGKLISSIMTHSLIEMEKHPDVTQDDLKLGELSLLLKKYIDTGEIDYEEVASLFDELGLNINQGKELIDLE